METVILVGPPNSGKSSIYNLLTGKLRHVSNYSGITVDNAESELLSNKSEERKISVVDLPGINGLLPGSYDEAVTVKTILGLDSNISSFNGVAVILDVNRLEFSLGLLLYLRDVLGSHAQGPGSERLVAIINKADTNEVLPPEKLAKLKERIGVEILPFSALKGDVNVLDKFFRHNLKEGSVKAEKKLLITKRSLDFFKMSRENISNHLIVVDDSHETELLAKVEKYHRDARKILDDIFSNVKAPKVVLTERIDKILLHPLWGSLIFVAIFYLLFHAIYSWSAPVMELIDGFIGWLGSKLSTLMDDGLLKSLVIDGILAGVGGVIIFLPQIIILFFLLSLLELSGYIARAAFLTDRLMGFFGLSGKSFLPYLSGLACAVPAIMSTRTIPNRFERTVTIMTIPLMTCSARLPVYILLIGTFIPSTQLLGFFNLQALSFFFLYFLGGISALVIAKVLRLSFFKGEGAGFLMDLPLYQRPPLMTAWKHSWRQGKIFLTKAGTIILTFSIVFWVASTFPRPTDVQLASLEGKSEEQVASFTLENSLIGRVGKGIEPVLTPIGMNWKMGVGILVAFGARELFVSSMGTMYALGDVDETSEPLRERLKNEVDVTTGRSVFDIGTVWALLFFFVFSLQCTSTMAMVMRETGGFVLPVIMFLYMGLLGYGMAFLAHTFLM
ncbi:MAG: ferrous iron transport protein B [Bdellovibrio sp.]|nr:ferrous iron transport protein B [Bdellovibrio sp.]